MTDGTAGDEEDEEEVESELDDQEGLSQPQVQAYGCIAHCIIEEEEEEYFEQELDPQAKAFQEGGVNKQLVVSKERSYVENRGRIGVFKNSSDMGELQYVATINKLVPPKGKAFIPKKACLN